MMVELKGSFCAQRHGVPNQRQLWECDVTCFLNFNYNYEIQAHYHRGEHARGTNQTTSIILKESLFG